MTNPNRAILYAALAAVLPLSTAHAQVVPRPNCDNLDRVETGLSGETTAAEISSGANKLGFSCNTQVVGQYQGEGASWQLTAWKNCAYFDQRLNAAEVNPGTVVVDVSDPKNPKPTAWLNTPAMLDPWESVKVNPARQLLGAGQRPSTGFAIYDISQDCAHPVLKSSVDFPGSFGHTGQWAPDGNTYYITPLRTNPSVVVVDTKDVTNPKLIPCGGSAADGCNAQGFFVLPATVNSVALNPQWHDLEFSKDGNTAYVTMFGGATTLNGLLLLDVSDFQQRRANPMPRVISALTWADGSRGAQNALPITIAGKPYILFSDEAGGGTAGCASGLAPSGFPRLIDITDPKNPKTVSKLMLDVHDPANCTKITASQVTSSTTNPQGGFGYSCHYCNVDDVDNATVAACECFAAGLRIFDIHDPASPKEIAYLKAPAQGTKALAGSQYSDPARSGPAGFVKNYDWATSKPSFPKDRGMPSGDLWTTFQDNGFMVVRMGHLTSGCNNAGATFGVVALLALMPLVQRLRRRR